ncbi:hypothetical protein BKA63DRAFT_227353 [Paraphoma chrysanthemicola]|nr:hypothetical protein BKA63DRAFT_227353 [Paraphoma chrysanthemicola]
MEKCPATQGVPLRRDGHYMNCAPVSINGGKGDATFLASLPDMFVANLVGTSCTTVEDFDFVFPQPGDSVSTGAPVTIASLQGGGCASAALDSNAEVIRSLEVEQTVSQSASGYLRQQLPTSVADKGAAAIKSSSVIPQIKSENSASCMPCSEDGSIVCIDRMHFGLCNHGCATRQLLADGTSCWQGSIVRNKR